MLSRPDGDTVYVLRRHDEGGVNIVVKADAVGSGDVVLAISHARRVGEEEEKAHVDGVPTLNCQRSCTCALLV